MNINHFPKMYNQLCNGLSIGHLNVYHLAKKVPDISVLLNTHFCHIFGVSETRLTSTQNGDDETLNTVDDETLCPPNYQIMRRDRTNCQPLHMGLGVFVHNTVVPFVKRRTDLEPTNIECVWVEFKRGQSHRPLLIGTLYRNGAYGSEWTANFVKMMDNIFLKYKDVVLLGDFNINLKRKHVSWSNTLSMLNLTQVINEPTRIDGTCESLLDHIYTNNRPSLSNIKVKDSSISDHKSIFCTWSCKPLPYDKKASHTVIEYRSFKNFDASDFCHSLSLTPFDSVLNAKTAEYALDCFVNIFMSVVNQHAPLRHHRVKHPSLPPWLTSEVVEAMKLRDSYKQAKKIEEFRRQRNKVTQLVRSTKAKYFDRLIEDNKSVGTVWRAINEVLNKSNNKSSNPASPISPETFNDFFLTLSDRLLLNNQKNSCAPQSNHSILHEFCNSKLETDTNFSIPSLTVYEVGQYVEHLSNKKSMGPDKLPPTLLKLALPYIVEPLTFTYNLCIEQCVFPSALKIAKVVPIPKGKINKEPGDFRPISLLPILAKPLERHIHKHLMEYLERNELFHNFQSGFRAKHSCNTALNALCSSWLSSIHSSNVTGAVFLDFKKAFDLVDHSILLKKLNLYIRNTKTLDIFRSYLGHRRQYVSINCRTSSSGLSLCGVPQGSILGPLLFCIHINDLPLNISDSSVRCDLFADDSTIHTSNKNMLKIESSLQHALREVETWCDVNRMILHPSKTKSMILTTRQKHQLAPLTLNLTINDVPIEQVREHKVLGVIIDEELSWESHINYICKKLSRNLYLLSKLTQFANKKTLLMFTHAHIMSHINYASSLWDGASKNNLKKLISLHRRSAKLILRSETISTDNKLLKLNILPLHRQCLFNKAVLMFKVYSNKAPSSISGLFSKSTNRYGSLNFILPKARIEICKTSLSFSGAAVWNDLPLSIKLSASISVFKTKLHKYLISLG